jgi:hypothetical protein
MTHIERIEFDIKTGDVSQGNAGDDSRVYCLIAGREFRLEKSGSEFGQGDHDVFIAGQGSPSANISNASKNDPNDPQLLIRNLPAETANIPGLGPTPPDFKAGTRPQPIIIRYVPKDQQKGWQLEDAHVRVVSVGGTSTGFPPSNVFEFHVPGGQSNNRWLGNDFGTAVELELMD